TAQPVSSKAVVERYGLDISPATVRNEMAALETLGYLMHPHTSAGRVPTEEGYRYFVEHLLGETELPIVEQRMIRHMFHQARLELDQWVRLSAAILAHTTRAAALATPPKAPQSRFKHLELISIHGPVVLLVLVFEQGMIKQQMLEVDPPRGQEELSQLSGRLNHLLQGASATDIAGRVVGLSELEQKIAGIVQDIMQRVDCRLSDQIHRDGLSQVLQQPEFVGSDKIRQLVAVFEERPLLEEILSHNLQVGSIQVVIGGEGRWQALSDVSLILSRYGVEETATGVLGVIGPVRMPYGHAISAVRYVSRLMSDLLRDLYGVGDWANPAC
ncbi:MAG TPA: heat-inducible transcription repressor HrcA, partial [Anaerolineae bacterium]|nr:heat-inducible transcription repressor HrcA [Anaerolineae bacterium]